MWHGVDGMGWWMLWDGLTMILFWGLVVAVVAWGIKALAERGSDSSQMPGLAVAPGPPVEIAKERYARGEINADEFGDIRRRLQDPKELRG